MTRSPITTDRERKAYILTPFGRSVLKAELVRLRHLVDVAGLQPLEEGG